jgi:hypothetical protein
MIKSRAKLVARKDVLAILSLWTKKFGSIGKEADQDQNGLECLTKKPSTMFN